MRRTEALASDAGLLIERRKALDGGVRLRERDIRGHSIPRRRIGNQAQSCIKRGTCVRGGEVVMVVVLVVGKLKLAVLVVLVV